VVVGNEERGLRRLTLEACDAICAIGPGADLGESESLVSGGAVAPTSLNVSVATGVLLAMLARPPASA
jgi:23S rRNA (guanosine2251-2'-O)-methyltransferase